MGRSLNFYKHHLGDYSAATAHLTWDEDCAYRRLMDCYYRREAPIPSDAKEACRLARAVSPVQRRAVETVLREFFSLESDGWHQKRCDEELTQYQAQATTNRSIAQRRESARRERIEHESLNESSTSATESREPNHEPLTTNHKPRTKNQEPEEKKRSAALLAAVDLDLPADLAEEFLAHRKRKRAPLTASALAGLKAEALKAGVSLESAVRKALARGWTGFEAAWLDPTRTVNGSKQSALEERNRAAVDAFVAMGEPDASH
jgi:uncharacterized protein YdaU (DUF1376 family)